VTGEEEEEEEEEACEWVQCDGCAKWRRLGGGVTAESLPDQWSCAMNTWDEKSASCDAPQQPGYESDEDEEEDDNNVDQADTAAAAAAALEDPSNAASTVEAKAEAKAEVCIPSIPLALSTLIILFHPTRRRRANPISAFSESMPVSWSNVRSSGRVKQWRGGGRG